MGRKSNYGDGMFNQLQEIMGRLDFMESELRTEKKEHKEAVLKGKDNSHKMSRF